MLPAFFAEQLEKDVVINERWVQLLEDHEDDLTAEIRLLVSQLINAQHIWNCRLQGAIPESDLNDLMPVHHWKQLIRANYHDTKRFLDDHSAEEKIRYHDSEGVQLEELPANMLFALLQNNQFFRAQLEYVCLSQHFPVPASELFRL